MRWLIRKTKQRGNGSNVHQDALYEGESISIGRSPSQTLFLSDLKVPLEHAEIIPIKANRYRIESRSASGVKVNGKSIQKTVVTSGAKIEVNRYVIHLVKAPKGYDAALELVELSEEDHQRNTGSHQTLNLKQTWLNKRSTSWFLFLFFITIGLLIPVAGYMVPGLQSVFRAIPGLPSDQIWDSGQRQSAHHLLGEDCSSCHSKAFHQVANPDCQSCHTTIAAHADTGLFNQPVMTDARCDHCHREHNGANGLILTQSSLCSDCHERLKQLTDGISLRANVSDFDQSHPQFLVDLARWDDDGNYLTEAFSLDQPDLSEQSNLKFPHSLHLREEGLNSPAGKKYLGCADCHQTETGGKRMLAVDFETMCQDCHRLGFDARSPERQVPHAKVPEILFTLEEYYANRALIGGYDDVTAPAVVRKRRRPGQRLTASEQKDVLAWARNKALRVGEDLFEGQACSVCHRVEKNREPGQVSWKVQPVRLTGSWFEGAFFEHNAHVTMQCADCHEAGSSDDSNDVLMPGIENCRACHGDVGTAGRVPSPCLSCHLFHTDSDLWPNTKEAL